MSDQVLHPNLSEKSSEERRGEQNKGKEDKVDKNFPAIKSEKEKGGGEIPSSGMPLPSKKIISSANDDTKDNNLTVTDLKKDNELEILEAEDVDIIEKPWVKKAKEIIEKDKGNPYFEEKDHEDLQIDYLKKRFGKEIKKSDD